MGNAQFGRFVIVHLSGEEMRNHPGYFLSYQVTMPEAGSAPGNRIVSVQLGRHFFISERQDL